MKTAIGFKIYLLEVNNKQIGSFSVKSNTEIFYEVNKIFKKFNYKILLDDLDTLFLLNVDDSYNLKEYSLSIKKEA